MTCKAFDLTGRVSLVAGGNSDIGLGLAGAQAGAGVCIWGANEEKNKAALVLVDVPAGPSWR